MKVSIKRIKAEKRLFHNVRLDVYPRNIAFEEIDFWQENYRTLLHIDILEAEKGKSIQNLTIEEITKFLVQRPELRLAELAASIEKNGVKVPLIILTDGLLLDGNRRYFACSHILHKTKDKGLPIPEVLTEIPTFVIKKEDVDDRIIQKILAEANFVQDYKVEWSLDVRAKVIADFYQACIKKKMSREKAYEEINDVYSLKKGGVDAYIETIQLTDEFISTAPRKRRNDFRELVQSKFVYFWEFRDKAIKGSYALDTTTELPKVKKLFFDMIKNERFKNMKQVEPMIRSVRDKHLWKLLSTSGGTKIEMVDVIIKEQKAIKSAEDKVRNFLIWLQTKADLSTFTNATFTLLGKLVTAGSELIKRRSK